jgi:hypothetical protein
MRIAPVGIACSISTGTSEAHDATVAVAAREPG